MDLHESSAEDVSDTVPHVPDSVQAACKAASWGISPADSLRSENSDPRYVVVLALALVLDENVQEQELQLTFSSRSVSGSPRRAT